MELSPAFMTIIFNGYIYVCMVKMYVDTRHTSATRKGIHSWRGKPVD